MPKQEIENIVYTLFFYLLLTDLKIFASKIDSSNLIKITLIIWLSTIKNFISKTEMFLQENKTSENVTNQKKKSRKFWKVKISLSWNYFFNKINNFK